VHSLVLARIRSAPLVLGLAVCSMTPRVVAAPGPNAPLPLPGVPACIVSQAGESAGWAGALRALGVPIVAVRGEPIASAEAFVAAARARGPASLCGLRADPGGATVWLYRARLGGHGELLEATLGPAPPTAGEASMMLALRLRLEMLSQAPTGTGRFIPARRPSPPAPLPDEAGLDFAPPPLTPLPERPAADLPTPVSERVVAGPAAAVYEVTVEAPGADAVRVVAPSETRRPVDPHAPWSMGGQSTLVGLGPTAFGWATGLVVRSPSLLADETVRVDVGWAPLAILRDSVSLRGPWILSADLAWSAELASDLDAVVAGAVEAELGDTEHLPGSTAPRLRFGPRVGLAVRCPALGDSTLRLLGGALWATAEAPTLGLQSTIVWPLL